MLNRCLHLTVLVIIRNKYKKTLEENCQLKKRFIEFENDLNIGIEKLNSLNKERTELDLANGNRAQELQYLSGRIQNQDSG